MRRALKLLLILGVGLYMARPKGGGDGPDGGGNGPDGPDGNDVDPLTGRPKDSAEREERLNFQGKNDSTEMAEVHDTAKTEAESGRAGESSQDPDRADPAGDPPPYRSDADPAADVFGPGRESNPAEWNALLDEARALGVDIVQDTNNIGYAPGLRPGQPGQLQIPEDASYSALLHEMNHLRDDQALGWGGFEPAYDPDFMSQSEADAYQVEIDYANEQGQPGLAADLEALRDARLQQIADDAARQAEEYGEDS
ncbi:MAG: hypothetical protein HOQ43_21460 [Glycomyces artemisiae]|uniref:Uncharacterized protein n=1 Tax=Glycomyces artemisiae TaxID=1076443 RepID=A0A850CG20_9ACTN|nr:hypothetical protein [Glycomyces artemisiae]